MTVHPLVLFIGVPIATVTVLAVLMSVVQLLTKGKITWHKEILRKP